MSKTQRPLIFIADLTHTAQGIAALSFPLGTAFVAAYTKKTFGNDVELRLFKFPEDLAEALTESQPSVLAFSCYSWNLAIATRIAEWAKARHPDLCVVFGGPNFPTVDDERQDFLARHPVIDFFIENEGEVGFVTVLGRLLDNGLSATALRRSGEVIANCNYLSGDALVNGPINRILDVNDIPSPYLSGFLDPFFDKPLVPMIETARGCPFSCAFCSDGLASKNKVTRFEQDRVRAELDYVADRVRDVNELIITDLNFGMYKQDEATALYIAEMQERRNWPIAVKASAGKNKPERIINVASILKGSWSIGSSVQSSDPDVLGNIRRSNISSQAYVDFMAFANNQSKVSQSYSEIILALPGDTKEKHFGSLRFSVENGANTLRMFQAMMLTGTHMASRQVRTAHGLLTRFRVLAGCAGFYKLGEDTVPIAELEEIIVGGKGMTFEEYVDCRVMNLIVEAFYNNGIFNELYASVEALGVPRFDVLRTIYCTPSLHSGRIAEIIGDFRKATTDCLFESREAAEAFLRQPDVLTKYETGELGSNELLEHKARLYMQFEDLCDAIFGAARLCLTERGLLTDDIDAYLTDLRKYIVYRKKNVHLADEEYAETFGFDFLKLDNQHFDIAPEALETAAGPVCLRFYHDSRQRAEIRNAVELYRHHPGGLARMFYKSNLQTMYRQVARA